MSEENEMRVLTVRQPWAWAIIHAGKDVENRTYNIAGSYRGPVAIHAAKNFGTMAEYAQATKTVRALTGGLMGEEITGAIIGVVDLVGVHDSSDCWQKDMDRLVADYNAGGTRKAAVEALPDWGGGGLIGKARLCSIWGQESAYHLELANPRPITPIPYRGGLGLRKITDPEIINALNGDTQ